MNERIIWRPNSIPLDEWEMLSREDQIRWWKERQPPPGVPTHPLRAVRLYQRGVISQTEFPTFVFERLTADVVGQFLEGCPAELMPFLQEASERLPADDDIEGWEKTVCISAACYPPWVSLEDIKQARHKDQQRYRTGLQVFRKATAMK